MRVIWVIAILTGILCSAVPPTYYKDVLPVLARNCQNCHRVGEAAPMPLVTYKDAWPWAKSTCQVVLTKKMPPWLAHPAVGHQRCEEMTVGTVDVAIDAHMDPIDLYRAARKGSE
jgi:hypothetical protein